MYLMAWLSNRLGWKVIDTKPNLCFHFQSASEKIGASIESVQWEKLGSGTVIAAEITTSQEHTFKAERIKERYHYVKIHTSSTDTCELPYEFVLGQTATGQSLVREICMKGTSPHYIDMLKELIILDKDKLC